VDRETCCGERGRSQEGIMNRRIFKGGKEERRSIETEDHAIDRWTKDKYYENELFDPFENGSFISLPYHPGITGKNPFQLLLLRGKERPASFQFSLR